MTLKQMRLVLAAKVFGALCIVLLTGFAVAQDEELPSCAVLPISAHPSVSPGLPSVVAARLMDALHGEGDAVLVPRDVVQTRLSQQGFDRASFETETEAATAAGLAIRSDYVLIGNIDRSAQGYSLSVSLVDVRAGQAVRRGTTQAILDPQDFVKRAPKSVVKFLIPPGQNVFALPPDSLPLAPDHSMGGSPAVVVAEPVETAVVMDNAPLLVDEPADSDATEMEPISVATYVQGYLEIGTRVTLSHLMRADDDHFLGTINHLELEQDFWPIKFFARWKYGKDFALELTWDRLRAEAQTPGNPDGVFSSIGPIVTGVLRFKSHSGWSPYAFGGLAWMFGSFDSHPWWGDGYNSLEEWESLHDTTPSSISRHMDVDDSLAVVVGGGAAYNFNERLALDLYLRYMSLELNDHYYIMQYDEVIDDRGVTKIPFDNVALGVGLTYAY